MAPDPIHNAWLTANQAWVQAAGAAVMAMIETRTAVGRPLSTSEVETHFHTHCEAADAQLPAPAAIDHLSTIFDLSPLERRILLTCLVTQIEPRINGWHGKASSAEGRPGDPLPGKALSFGLLRSLWADFDWQALLPSAPLRYWRLIEVQATSAVLESPLILDERVLHFCMGLQSPDDRIAAALRGGRAAPWLTPSQEERLDGLARTWTAAINAGERPLLRLAGPDRPALLAASQRLGSAVADGILHCSPAALVPPSADLADALRLIEREALLQNRLLVLEELDAPVLASQATLLGNWVDHLNGGVFVTALPTGWTSQRPQWVLRMDTPTQVEQAVLWREGLPDLTAASGGHQMHLAEEFDLPGETIRRIASSIRLDPDMAAGTMMARAQTLCREETRPKLTGLAQRLPARARWEDLVVPAATRELLEAIPGQVRHRQRIFEEWGFGRKTLRGKGIAALFCGASGTGKTLATEILATELALDLYQVDLSQVVDKYIGETEKHLARIFDAADQGGCILLLDEADALFGKRSEVRDSHDRHANIEVSYLLQRLEQFGGLAILTTNMREAIDEAFLRRLRFIVPFPFPDRKQRQAIWATIFPQETPVGNLDLSRLSQLSVSGGNIHNIALTAAFLAAQNGGRVEMTHLAAAARMEYAKLERPLTTGETGGWL